jgi:hypothetical protein
MNFDAFTAGIEPGGLRSQSDIRLLICYMLASVDEPLSKEDIVIVLQDNGLANYFEAASALSNVLDKGNIGTLPDNPDLCIATDKTREIAELLDNILPPSVRDRAVNGALSLLARAKRERENKVEIEKCGKDFKVTCHISGGERDMMTFSLLVPDQYQARAVKKNFQRNPELVYQSLLCLLTGDKGYLETLLKDV